MDSNKESEIKRAYRIYLRISENHTRLASVYEELVDREFQKAENEMKLIIKDLRLIIKSVNDKDEL